MSRLVMIFSAGDLPASVRVTHAIGTRAFTAVCAGIDCGVPEGGIEVIPWNAERRFGKGKQSLRNLSRQKPYVTDARSVFCEGLKARGGEQRSQCCHGIRRNELSADLVPGKASGFEQ